MNDFQPVFDEPFESVSEELERLSIKLRDLLPDPSIGPEERLERLSRVVRRSVMTSAHHLTARTKLRRIRARLDELVPGEISYEAKINALLDELDRQVPNGEDLTIFQKLELIGDARLSDDGRFGLPHTLLNCIRGLYQEPISIAEKIERAVKELTRLRAGGE
ncbi:hypothetical protein [Piscinibacter sp.]|uniref:hypothetical protein n=1 Tax=Piscinibacter sp. TaxID=1903157 RepID=UPI002BD06E5A|nr:hypothetical protein [Albitalea sp.]HUG23636.1 hypothetical protein [Albitalea sp.]